MVEGVAKRGQTVDISFRGYAAKETVRIRWKKGASWVEIGRITTSSTGSANAYLKVPSWAPDGPASIRGDGTICRAQTNAVTISGGTSRPSEAKKTRSPTATPSPSPSASPAAEPSATATTEPTQIVTTPEVTPSPMPSQTSEP